ncbi:MAG: hypothetical protein ABIN68_01210 [Sphingomicrobium sp.]
MASRLKIVTDPAAADLAPPRQVPDFTPAPTRNRHAGWTAARQRTFIERMALTGCVGEACALAGLSSTSFYRLCMKPGADSFVAACNAARVLASTRASAIVWDRAINGRVERFYKNGELVLERRIPSDHLLTWMLARLDPAQFGSPQAKAHVAATGDPLAKARKDLPRLLAGLADVPPEECECDAPQSIDHRLGEMDDGRVDTGD